jgi:alpha-L-rhamnosidase
VHELILDSVKGTACLLSCFGMGAPDMLTGRPCFSWKVYEFPGTQSAFQLILSERAEEIAAASGDVWDSGWIESSKSSRVPYTGRALKNNRDYYAAVRVRNEHGDITPYSGTIRFSTGLLESSAWQAPWLCASVAAKVQPLFRREFSLTKEVKRARLFICGLGYYEAYINGRKTGDRLLDPSWTDFSKRACYVAYNVTSMLGTKNVIGIMLGNGWYVSDYNRPRPLFTAQLIIEYADGGEERIISAPKSGWFVHMDGPMRSCNIFMGEVYDARKEKAGWASPGFDMRDPAAGVWLHAIEAEPPAKMLTPMMEEPIRVIGEVSPVSLKVLESGFKMADLAQLAAGKVSLSYKTADQKAVVVDFGQNLAGGVKLTMNCPTGTEVTIRYAEILHPDGSLNTDNLRTAQQRDLYIARGGGEEYAPRFTYHGFRYAEVSGLPNLKAEDIKAVVIRNDVTIRSRFNCSHELLNQIQKNCLWTESNNLHSVPTDCPQRDERQGWLNDLTVRAEESVYNFDLSRFYRKFLMDISEAQGAKTGAIADTNPFRFNGSQPADPVSSSYLILPWLLYIHHGDKEALERHYKGLASWTAYLENMSEDGIVLYSYYGDWAAPIAGNDAGSVGAGAVSTITPGRIMSTGYLYLNARIMADIARVLGKDADIQYYESLAGAVKEALNRVYLNREKGYYAANSQAANTFMLYLGVVPEEYHAAVVENLVKDIRAHGTHLTTGNLCTRYVFDVLADNGYIDLAYELAVQTTYPSWGYMISKGATTTWERWEHVESGPLLGMASHNHPMYATISGWFYTYLLGIRPLEPGFKTFSFKPYIPSSLSWAEGVIKSDKGDIKARWEQKEGGVYMSVTVPFNSCCRLILPRNRSVLVNQAKAEIQARDGSAFIILEPGSYEIFNE